MYLCRAMDIPEGDNDIKKIEALLGKSEARFSTFFESGPLGMAIINLHYRFKTANFMLCRMLGCSKEELMNKPFFDIIHPKDKDTSRGIARKILGGKFLRSKLALRLIKKNGVAIWCSMTGTVIRDKKGAPLYFLVMLSDISKSKRIEAELKDSREQLRVFAAHLQSVQEDERTKIAREIHDELSQALTVLKIDLIELADELEHADPGSYSQLGERVTAMSKFVDSVIEVGHRIAMELRPSILDDLGLVAAIEWKLNEFSKRTGIKCAFNHSDNMVFNEKITTALFRILQEALTNVARHAGATEVTVDLYTKAGSMILKVEDNGKGIDERMVCGSQSLGLLGMRERAVLLRGEISIYGSPGEGSAIIVYIPVGR